MLLKGGDSPAAQWCNVECTAQIRARSGGRIPFCEANTTRRRPTVTLIAKLATVIIDASNFKAGECITAPNSSDKMAADQQFCLRWNNHQSTLIQVFDTLLASEQLVDCTLAAEGQYLKAHKVVLSACSPYLELLLAQHYEKHPIVILKDVKFQELKSMMDYMYRGEVNISQDQLSTFLKAAESLQIKGLTDSGEDSRDVGSTKRVDGAAQGARKAAAATGAAAASSGSNRASPAVGGTGLTIEPRPASPHHRDASLSPTPRKRRRARRPSQGDAPDSHNDTSNSCDLPPASALAPPEQHIETEHINNRLQNSNNMELIKEKVEPTPELMIEPKTEYMDENNEDSVEDLTLDDDDDLDMNRSGMDMGRPGPSHGDSNQGFATSWHMQGDRSGTDEVFMAAQEAVGAAHRDSQDELRSKLNSIKSELQNMDSVSSDDYYYATAFLSQQLSAADDDDDDGRLSVASLGDKVSALSDKIKKYPCDNCGKVYTLRHNLNRHKKYECGKQPQLVCSFCQKKFTYKSTLQLHVASQHLRVF
ncbi:longitudinals lacking protein, isoforms F/I/K/T isoform X14 [Nilaparvata lugens]|uniref:longitudinals lacking protein, isoforms F/I/K/T isoform X14 n=1 Tax=Nilaparvata lugens TaxID=108931 RepID=UPI00193DC4CC|nr:longitudinals lacking protein, isoforms F/I/K/T isoform X14 [Nilaparvata lugens]